ncbi:hypothetical protein ACS386_07845 [Flavobacteriaceae bacterium LMO-SS05]
MLSINGFPIDKLHHTSYANSRPYPDFLVPPKDDLGSDLTN